MSLPSKDHRKTPIDLDEGQLITVGNGHPVCTIADIDHIADLVVVVWINSANRPDGALCHRSFVESQLAAGRWEKLGGLT